MVLSRSLSRVLLRALLLGLGAVAGYFMAGWWSGMRDTTPLAQICARVDYVNGLQEIRKRAQVLGDVEAASREAAELVAVRQFNLNEDQRKRLVVQERG